MLRFMHRRGLRTLHAAVCLFLPALAIADEPAPPVSSPATVSLHIKYASREEALLALSTATGLSFTPADHSQWNPKYWPNKTIDLDFDNEQFWVALGKFQEATDIGFTARQNGTYQAVTDRGDWAWTGQPQIAAGPILLTVGRIHRDTTVRWSDADHPIDEVELEITGTPQPHAWIDLSEGSFKVTSLTDAVGTNLLPDKLYGSMVKAEVKEYRVNLRVRVPVPRGNARKSVVLSGSVHCAQVTSTVHIDLPDAEKELAAKKVCGQPVTIRVSRPRNNVVVVISTQEPADSDSDAYGKFLSHMRQAWTQPITITDSNGQVHKSTATALYPDRDNSDLTWNAYCYFEPVPAGPIELKWAAPATVSEMDLPIRIEGIPLP